MVVEDYSNPRVGTIFNKKGSLCEPFLLHANKYILFKLAHQAPTVI